MQQDAGDNFCSIWHLRYELGIIDKEKVAFYTTAHLSSEYCPLTANIFIKSLFKKCKLSLEEGFYCDEIPKRTSSIKIDLRWML